MDHVISPNVKRLRHVVSLPWRFVLTGLMLTLTGCGHFKSSHPDDLLTDANAKIALAALQARLPPDPRVLRIELGSLQLTVEAQDPSAPTHVDSYRYSLPEKGRFQKILPASVSGPEPVVLNLQNPHLEENLFHLSEIDFDAVAATARAAIERTGLEGGGAIESIQMRRHLLILPVPHNTQVEWEISIRSPRENAVAYANAKGVITGFDLDGTSRAKNLDYLAGGAPLGDALALMRQVFGNGPVFMNINLPTATVVVFRAKDPAEPHEVKEYNCTINGIHESLAEVATRGTMPPDAKKIAAEMRGESEAQLFSLDDVNLSRYEAMKKATLAKLAIPDGRLRTVTLKRPAGVAAARPVQWIFQVHGDQGEGLVEFDRQGSILRYELPPGREPPRNFLGPANIRLLLTGLRTDLSAETRLLEIDVRDDGLFVDVPDLHNAKLSTVYTCRLGEAPRKFAPGQRVFYPGPLETSAFDLDDLQNGPVANLEALEAQALRQTHIAGGKVTRIRFFRESPFFPASNQVLSGILIEANGDSEELTFDPKGRLLKP